MDTKLVNECSFFIKWIFNVTFNWIIASMDNLISFVNFSHHHHHTNKQWKLFILSELLYYKKNRSTKFHSQWNVLISESKRGTQGERIEQWQLKSCMACSFVLILGGKWIWMLSIVINWPQNASMLLNRQCLQSNLWHKWFNSFDSMI